MTYLQTCFDDNQKESLNCISPYEVNNNHFYCECCKMEKNVSSCIASTHDHLSHENKENGTYPILGIDGLAGNETINFYDYRTNCTADNGNQFFCETKVQDRNLTSCGCKDSNNAISNSKNFSSTDVWGHFSQPTYIYGSDHNAILYPILVGLLFFLVFFCIVGLCFIAYYVCFKNFRIKIVDVTKNQPVFVFHKKNDEETCQMIEI